ncbi:MAG: TVP38/TMEM64 family protein [Syntrophomonadaceae bacterium]|nr:TVP38/TMEM64 family protein [Syntrophomonadaceae bacterium]
MKRIPTLQLLGLLLLLVSSGSIVYLGFVYAPFFVQLAQDPEQFREYLLRFGPRGILVFVLIQALQVIIAAIPGELTQLAGGYLFGALGGILYSCAGIILGSVAAFGITHVLGYPVLKAIMPQTRLERFAFFINSPRVEMLTFLLFLLPGMPKDALTYIAGLTPIRPLTFFMVSSLARLPGIVITSYIGAGIEQNQYIEAAVAALLSVLLLSLGWIFKDRLLAKFRSWR